MNDEEDKESVKEELQNMIKSIGDKKKKGQLKWKKKRVLQSAKPSTSYQE